jgi:hypothetical protein
VLRQFAFLAVIGLPLIAALVLRLCGVFAWTHPALLATAAVGVLQLVAFLGGITAVTHAVFVTIMVVAAPLGFVISHVLIAAVFYLVITPIGLVFRLMGRDALKRRLDRSAPTYWTERRTPRPASSYFKLY